MDKIIIDHLEIDTVIGVYDWERENAQKLIFDLVISADLSNAMKSDRVEDTIDYAKVAQSIEQLTKIHKPELLERFADITFEYLFNEFDIFAIQMKITKPDILTQARSVGIELYREKTGEAL